MRVELFPFQKRALADIRMKTAEAMGSYHRTHAPQVVSFTAPTGAGKTIIMSALIEAILFGDEQYMEQQDAIIVWLSDSPQLNEQSKQKIDSKADKIKLSQCVTVSEESFDKEVFEDGHVYFLNTQKLSVTSKLTKNGDGRTYTIWQTLANTVREKSDRLYFIIDEAHRGMQGREASKATTIMQKFIKGSDEDHIPPMPVVIGMSATTQRFNALVEGTCRIFEKQNPTGRRRKQRYIQPSSRRSDTLKPPRKLQPKVVHRSIFQCLCATLPQIEMNCAANHRMLHIVRKAIAVQQIGLLTLGKSAQTLVQLSHGFFVHINLFRRFDSRISNGFNAQQPFLTGKDLIQPDFLQGKSVYGAGHSLLILGENIPYQVGHGVADERCGISQKLDALTAVKEGNGGQQTEVALLFQIAGFCTEATLC